MESLLRKSPGLHLYAIGDLDEPYRSRTRFFTRPRESGGTDVALLYAGSSPATLLALTDGSPAEMARFVCELAPMLEHATYVHASPSVTAHLASTFDIESHGSHLKMLLTRGEVAQRPTSIEIVHLSTRDEAEIANLYRDAYPDNFFDPVSLQSGFVIGARDNAELVSIAGIHTLSRTKRVAALGNITTHPRARGRGLARTLTAALCQLLAPHVEHIGLNVAEDNAAALHVYRSIGFEVVARYDEAIIRKRT